jgi:hypothetical protein
VAKVQEKAAEIDQIKGSMCCPKGFACCSSDFSQVGKVKIIGDGKLLDCLEADAARCQLALPFGDGFFCTCRLRKYIAKTFRI